MAPSASFEAVFPDYFDQDALVIEAKGYFADLTVQSGGKTYRPVVYDAVRLAQEVADAVERDEVFVEANLIVVPTVTRSEILRALDRLARSDFAGLMPS